MKAIDISAKKRPRLRHWRGHGIHSPFVYSLVREVFMCRGLTESCNELYGELISKGVTKKAAVQLQNLYHFCAFGSFSINDFPSIAENHLCIHTSPLSQEEIPAFRMGEKDNALCIICGRSMRKKQICRKMVDKHTGVSIDRKGYYLYFYTPEPRKQHYKL